MARYRSRHVTKRNADIFRTDFNLKKCSVRLVRLLEDTPIKIERPDEDFKVGSAIECLRDNDIESLFDDPTNSKKFHKLTSFIKEIDKSTDSKDLVTSNIVEQYPLSKCKKVGSKFKCSICGKLFSCRHSWRFHVKIHIVGKRFKCHFENCNLKFSTDYARKLHSKTHFKSKRESKTRKFWCDVEGCEEVFPTMKLFKLHIQTHTKEMGEFACNLKQHCEMSNTSSQHQNPETTTTGQSDSKNKDENMNIFLSDNLSGELYLCSHCGMQFSRKDTFEAHARSHMSTKSFQCDFERCGKTFFSELGLELHIQIIHARERKEMKYTCDIEECGKTFVRYNAYELHIRSHKGDRPFSCSNQKCGLKFMTSVQLENHEIRHHQREHKVFPYICEVSGCGKQFTRGRNLQIHKLRHKHKRCFSCKAEGCDQIMWTVEALNQHMKKDHPGILFPCEFEGCDKKLSNWFSLQVHVKGHSKPKKTTASCLCVLCGKMFPSQGRLNLHNWIKHSEKNFVCNYCGKKFTFEKTLDSHTRKHIEDDPDRICEVEGCGLKFVTVTEKKLHVRRMHPEHRPVKCDICGATFNDQGQLTKHNYKHDTFKRYPCKFEGCDKVFSNSGTRSTHQFVHTKAKPWVCVIDNCESRFKQKYLLDAHISVQHMGIKPYACTWEGCDRRFGYHSDLRRHLKRHMGIKDFVCDFEGCGQSFVANSDLTKHRRVHSDAKTFQCQAEGCTKTFKTPKQLRDHRKTYHDSEFPYVCTENGCTSKFTHQYKLDRHLQSHKPEKMHACDFMNCGQLFVTKLALSKHKVSHRSINTNTDYITNSQDVKDFFISDYNGCGRSFESQSQLNRHTVSHTMKTYLCEVENCTQVFKTLEAFNKHLLIKHLNVKSFQCDFEGCSKKFNAKHKLTLHRRTHTGDYLHICTYENCNRKFNSASHLRDHMLYHSGEKNYVCEVLGCGKKYFSPIAVKKHFRKVHKKKINQHTFQGKPSF